MAQRLLMGLCMERFNPYRKWQGPHWTLYSLAEIGFPAGGEALLPLRGMAHWARAAGDKRAQLAAKSAAEFLLARRLLWRKRDGGLIVPEWGGPVDKVHYPIRFYDVLSALVVMAEMGLARDGRCQDALDLLERKRLADGMFPAEWTNVRQADRIETRGTYANWGTLHKKKGNLLVTVDALYVLREAGRG